MTKLQLKALESILDNVATMIPIATGAAEIADMDTTTFFGNQLFNLAYKNLQMSVKITEMIRKGEYEKEDD